MKNDHRSTAALWIMLVAVAAMFAGCSSPASVDSNETLPSQQPVYVVDCPTLEQVSADIVAELEQNCPRTRDYRHWGELNSCEKKTIGQMLEPYDGCFSDTQLKLLRIRVEQMRYADRDKPIDLPRPRQDY